MSDLPTLNPTFYRAGEIVRAECECCAVAAPYAGHFFRSATMHSVTLIPVPAASDEFRRPPSGLAQDLSRALDKAATLTNDLELGACSTESAHRRARDIRDLLFAILDRDNLPDYRESQQGEALTRKIAWLLWCAREGYLRAEDRALLTQPTIFETPIDDLHPDDQESVYGFLDLAKAVVDELGR